MLLAYISGSVDEEFLLRNEYLIAENRISVPLRRDDALTHRIRIRMEPSVVLIHLRDVCLQRCRAVATAVTDVKCNTLARLSDHGDPDPLPGLLFLNTAPHLVVVYLPNADKYNGPVPSPLRVVN